MSDIALQITGNLIVVFTMKKTLKLRKTGTLWGKIHRRILDFPNKGGSNGESISIIWHHHVVRESSAQWSSSLLWWRHQIETFSALLAICAGNSPVTGEFPAQRQVTRSFDVFLWSSPEPTDEQTMETQVIWDATALIKNVIVMVDDSVSRIYVSRDRVGLWSIRRDRFTPLSPVTAHVFVWSYGKSGRSTQHRLIHNSGNCKIAICIEAEESGYVFKNYVSISVPAASSAVQYIIISLYVVTQRTGNLWKHKPSNWSPRE